MSAVEIVKECLKNRIACTAVDLTDNGELKFAIMGFSKSGSAWVYDSNGKTYSETRYGQIDEIEDFDDLARVAYNWNKSYHEDSAFGWDTQWIPVWEKLKLVTTKKITVETRSWDGNICTGTQIAVNDFK